MSPAAPAPVEDGGWGAEDAAPPATGTPAQPAAAAPTGYQPPPPPPPELLAKNRRLSAQMQRGERWLIGGRIGAPLSLIPTLIGVGMLAAHGARQRAAVYDDEFDRPPGRGLLVGGIAFTVIGVGALGASIYAAVHGFRLMQSARNGQFAFSVGPRHAGLSFRARF